MILFSFSDVKTGILTALIFLGSIASSLSISVSPTIYASGSRVFFLMDSLFIVIIGIYIINIFDKKVGTIFQPKLLDEKNGK